MGKSKDTFEPGETTAAHGSARGQRRVLRVWVVDDHASMRECFTEFLNFQRGFRCNRQFSSTQTVLAALAEERPPDLILMDVNLKQENGLNAIRPIKDLAPSVGVVMMTTFSNSHYEKEAFLAGASGFLLKTYDLDQILRIMREAYERPGARDLFPNLIWHEDALKPAFANTSLVHNPATS